MAGELETLEMAYLAAMARLGLALGQLARDEWRSVNPLSPGGGDWESRVWRLLYGTRLTQRRLTETYYRLARAIETGRLLASSDSWSTARTLAELRGEFLFLIQQVFDFDFEVDPTTDPDQMLLYDYLADADRKHPDWFPRDELDEAIENWLGERGPDGDLRFEDFVWPQDRVESYEDAAEVFGDAILEAGPGDLQRKLDELAKKHADDADAYREAAQEEFETHGRKVAAIVDKAGMDAGRELIMDAAQKDRYRSSMRVARGTRASPCHFCAMLASRGFVYLSAQSAVGVTAYHPNCHCFPIIRWVSEELPERNSYFNKMWPEVTRGKSGRDARIAWRRWINAERRKSASVK